MTGLTKIILLDWDGPVANPRTTNMPGYADPVAIEFLNKAAVFGWQTVLTSTMRKNYDTVSAISEFMNGIGLYPNWFHSWRTDPNLVGHRHIEFVNWRKIVELPADTVFLSIDDEEYPETVAAQHRIIQRYIHTYNGMDYLTLTLLRDIICMSDDELREEVS